MKKFPIEIQKKIYEFDSTYREKYDRVMREILPRKGKFKIGTTHGYKVTAKYYAGDWKYKDCIHKGHTITMHKPYCVLGICQCGKTQLFFYKG